MTIYQCRRCGFLAFPRRLWCPTCGGRSWRRAKHAEGVVETVTCLERGYGIRSDEGHFVCTLRLDGGPAVIARLIERLEPGTPALVTLERGMIMAKRR